MCAKSAVRVAGYFGYAECVDLLLEACRDPDENVRRAAVEHLPYLEDRRAVPALLSALETGTPRVRAAAASALGEAPTALAIPPLLAALRDEGLWVRYAAARALAQHRSPDALETLERAARADPDTPVRVAALEALGQIGGARAVAVLASVIDAPESDLALSALGALGEIGHPDALAPLLASLRSTDPLYRRAAARSLGRRGGAGVAGALQWVAAADAAEDVGQAAIEALGQLATPEAIAALIELTMDSTRREASVTALSSVGQAHVGDVARGLIHPQPAVRQAVIEALVQMRRPEASDALGSALDHQDPQVRVAACRALARLGNRAAERKLALLAHSDPDQSVRTAAEKALRK